jgi:hypothetical protein
MIPPDSNCASDDVVSVDRGVVALTRIAPCDDALVVELDDPMKHQPRTEGNEDHVTTPRRAAERPDEDEVGVAHGRLHALARAGHPELPSGAHRVANELRRLGRGKLQ